MSPRFVIVVLIPGVVAIAVALATMRLLAHRWTIPGRGDKFTPAALVAVLLAIIAAELTASLLPPAPDY